MDGDDYTDALTMGIDSIAKLSTLSDRIQGDLINQSVLVDHSPWTNRAPMSNGMAETLARLQELERKKSRNKGNIEMYKRIRVDNIALSHEAAIELVNMINREASTLTGDEFE